MVCRRYEICFFFFGVIKHKAFGCFSVFCACPCLLFFFYEDLATLTPAGLMSAASPLLS